MTRKLSLLVPVVLAGLLPLAPASAQTKERVLIIYGADKCPTSNGEEITICARRSENERYRIPEELRSTTDPKNMTWADRAKSIEYAGASGIGSCSPVGSAGASGCFQKMISQARAERKTGQQ